MNNEIEQVNEVIRKKRVKHLPFSSYKGIQSVINAELDELIETDVEYDMFDMASSVGYYVKSDIIEIIEDWVCSEYVFDYNEIYDKLIDIIRKWMVKQEHQPHFTHWVNLEHELGGGNEPCQLANAYINLIHDEFGDEIKGWDENFIID